MAPERIPSDIPNNVDDLYYFMVNENITRFQYMENNIVHDFQCCLNNPVKSAFAKWNHEQQNWESVPELVAYQNIIYARTHNLPVYYL